MGEPAIDYEPELFDGLWPRDTVLERKAKAYLHTGKIACKDKARVERVCRAVLLRIPAREIARREKVGRETIDAMVAYAEQSGKLRPLAEALLTEATEIAMLAGHALKEALVKGKVQPQCLGMVWGTATDKVLLLTHSPTAIVEHKEAGSFEAGVRAAWDAIQRARAAASDSQADAQPTEVVAPHSPRLLADPAATEPATVTLDLPATAEPVREGRGGVTPPPAGPDARGATSQNFDP